MSNQKHSLEERLKAHPHLKQRIEKLLEIVEDASCDIDKADEAGKSGEIRDVVDGKSGKSVGKSGNQGRC